MKQQRRPLRAVDVGGAGLAVDVGRDAGEFVALRVVVRVLWACDVELLEPLAPEE